MTAPSTSPQGSGIQHSPDSSHSSHSSDSLLTPVTKHSTKSGGTLLVVTDLKVQFPTADGLVNAVSGLSYSVELGKTLAIVGESGSGKSVSSLAVLGLHNPKRTRMAGSIKLDGTEVIGLSEDKLRRLRSNIAAMIFQDPQSALHPFMKVGDQIAEAYLEHHPVNKASGRARAVEMLDRVGIPNPQRRARQYPHEFSGGMRQRAMIALALVNNPKLLIADEPTTALDVTVQAQILDLLNDLQKEFGSAIVLITHDLAVVAEVADDVLVMYGGRCVESGTVKEVLAAPRHPYTWGLLSSVPTLGAEGAELRAIRGAPPSLITLPAGCSFHPRCDFASRVPHGLCSSTLPELSSRPGQSEHPTRCHLSAPQDIYEDEIASTIG
jgi:peptide/nickel transport system ATP-binding protein